MRRTLEAVFERGRDDERVERTRVAGLMKALGVRDADLIETSYEELIRRPGAEPARQSHQPE